jgi:hypothetical protein
MGAYYAYSHNGDATWLSPVSGKPLLSGGVASGANQHDFHPQLARRPNGAIACAFYEFGPKWGGGPLLIATPSRPSSARCPRPSSCRPRAPA